MGIGQASFSTSAEAAERLLIFAHSKSRPSYFFLGHWLPLLTVLSLLLLGNFLVSFYDPPTKRDDPSDLPRNTWLPQSFDSFIHSFIHRLSLTPASKRNITKWRSNRRQITMFVPISFNDDCWGIDRGPASGQNSVVLQSAVSSKEVPQ